MKIKLFLTFVTLTLLTAPQAVFAQSDVDVGGTVDREAPTVNITNPANGSIVSGSVNVTATATDDVGVVKVEFFVDGNLAATDTSSPFGFTLDTTTLLKGTHTLLAHAFDADSKTGTDTVTFNVSEKTTL